MSSVLKAISWTSPLYLPKGAILQTIIQWDDVFSMDPSNPACSIQSFKVNSCSFGSDTADNTVTLSQANALDNLCSFEGRLNNNG